ncbi:MAG TPA: TIGR03936 family radical SAM-associated protein [Acidimicrobiales bacterium]|nr:TIGR03936 family radical SAM-associated protein [Acidimicrobiales bacterium]
MKVRLRYSKLGKIRWTSHRDMARMWERAFRRTHLPLAYSHGFSPRPKVSFGLALPTGGESLGEYLDVEVAPEAAGDVDVAALPGRLSTALPVGVEVAAAAVIDDRTPSLQHEVTSCGWTVRVDGMAHEELRELASAAVSAPQLLLARERKGHTTTEDVRPGILSCTAEDEGTLQCELATQPRALRPSELLRALRPDLEAALVRRTHQWIERDGARVEPLALLLDAMGARHAHGRAS